MVKVDSTDIMNISQDWTVKISPLNPTEAGQLDQTAPRSTALARPNGAATSLKVTFRWSVKVSQALKVRLQDPLTTACRTSSRLPAGPSSLPAGSQHEVQHEKGGEIPKEILPKSHRTSRTPGKRRKGYAAPLDPTCGNFTILMQPVTTTKFRSSKTAGANGIKCPAAKP